MINFFSRRAYSPTTHTFSKNPAALTRYGRYQVLADGTEQGSLIDRATWIAQVLASAQTPDILIYVHGYNTDHRDMLDRHRIIADRLTAEGFRGAVVSFDWPSDGRAPHYTQDRNDAKAVAEHFVTDGVLALRQAAPGHRLHVIAHSMGAYLTLRGFSGIGGSWKVNQVLSLRRTWIRTGW